MQNPSFEAGLTDWTSENVTLTNSLHFEGTQVATMGPDIAHMFQDVALIGTECSPLLLSFNAFGSSQPEMTINVLWLDAKRREIGTGLRLFIPQFTTDSDINARVTFYDITDSPPPGARFARLLFSSGPGGSVSIDQVILAITNTMNLVQNASFEVGLQSWTGPTFQPTFRSPLQGAVDVTTTLSGTLFQDVFIGNQPSNAPYLFSFGAFASGVAAMTVQVQWLDAGNNTIGSPGLEINIPTNILNNQVNYLTYLDITDPAPPGAVMARILFNPVMDEGSTLKIDQVLLARAGSANLIQNPSFEDGLIEWTPVSTQAVATNFVYEGTTEARTDVGVGGIIFQDVPIANAENHCFLLNYGLRVGRLGAGVAIADALVKVLWLDGDGKEIGLGLSLFGRGISAPAVGSRWLVYTGITEKAPPGTAAARVQFSIPSSSVDRNDFVAIDKVVFGRLV
ncbi:hypothetical protein [Ammoniphilus sp. CFH 90114]|uniref:hypothetical protein n=1 Tax=Ammoniphilus sp. CFH 90114 TaxID=2493665 RepID=UPI00100EACD7|nr:hypothetical protein [Ammoniphilus sp. CFH 90114]